MYCDSDNEAISGDEDDKAFRPKKRGETSSKPTVDIRKHEVRSVNGNSRKRLFSSSASYRGFHIHPVLVVDYDLTLVNKSSRPFPGSHEFLEALREFNDGHNQLILYSHGSAAYIEDGLNKHFEHEHKYFDEIISDSSARNNKPITHVRSVIKKTEFLIGPYVIIDDMRSNLDSDQYDIVIDIKRMTKYDKKGTAVSVDYDTCLKILEQGVRTFLAKKQKSTM